MDSGGWICVSLDGVGNQGRVRNMNGAEGLEELSKNGEISLRPHSFLSVFTGFGEPFRNRCPAQHRLEERN